MLKLFKRFRLREWLTVLGSLVLIVGQVWLDLTMPDYMSEITRLVQTPDSVMGDIWLAGERSFCAPWGAWCCRL